MSALRGIIREIIEKKGPIPVAGFMELALQHPEHGYYRRRDPIGRGGDFITAPEISQMFGEMIGLWCADVWQQLGKPNPFVLLELGPGRGTLMQDALRATHKITGFHGAMKLCLLESSAALRTAQQEKLAEYQPGYLDDLTHMPPLPILFIANEFFDALPIRQFEKTFQGWSERLVTVRDGALDFILSPTDPALALLIPAEKREANPGAVHEVSLPSLGIMRDLARHIVRHGGAGLVIDYGSADAPGKPTLQAVSNHRFTDILARPGEVDLTAHVDFGMLRGAAAGQGARVAGPVGQGEFLQTLGIELRAVQLKQRATPKQAQDIDEALRRLTDPSQMGSLFKAMAIASPQLQNPAGF